MKWQDFKRQMERQYWEEMIAQHKTVTAVAVAAGVSRDHVHDRLKLLGIAGMYQRKRQGGNQAWRSLGHQQ